MSHDIVFPVWRTLCWLRTELDPKRLHKCLACRSFSASGRDMHTMLYNFLDELLFVFSTELFVFAELSITTFNRDSWQISGTG